MKNSKALIPILLVIVLIGCNNSRQNQPANSETTNATDSIVIIKKNFKNSDMVEYEIPVFENTTMKHGIQKRYYTHGSLYSEIPYSYGKREGIAYTYYPAVKDLEPKVWKEQIYVDNELNGICKRFHKNGKLQAEYEYKDGLPAIGLKEYNDSGKPVTLPGLIINSNKLESNIYISTHLSNKAKQVDYYIGGLVEGKYLSNNMKGLQVKNGLGEVLVPLNTKNVTITAVYTTRYRNKYIITKTISL